MPTLPAFHLIAQQVSQALAEDIGCCDWSAQLIPVQVQAQAQVIVREEAVLCGQAWFEECFRQVDSHCQFIWHAQEGERIQKDSVLCDISGPARALLTAERAALNFLQMLSATASLTGRYVEQVTGTRAHLYDTRKTLPGLRLAQKYAVTVGGGDNQRIGLFDGVLLKENHIMAAGGIPAAMQAASALAPANISLQVEVETIEQLEQALAHGAKLILLDNMSLAQMCTAVAINAGRAQLEASGGIDLDNVRAIAETGIDRISVGELTKSLRAIDFSMRFTQG